ncbi:hypothetical protein A2U01_0072260, partial [Trifolium medium]|nr:hypothetical protein [Trifolium medium]
MVELSPEPVVVRAVLMVWPFLPFPCFSFSSISANSNLRKFQTSEGGGRARAPPR